MREIQVSAITDVVERLCIEANTDWVVLPATSFDNYYCSSYFSKKVLGKIPETILVRQERSGISRYYITEGFLP